MTKTATGMPGTWVGYWLGRLLCKVGIHKRASLTYWGYSGRSDLIVMWCIRDCQWGDERWAEARS